MKKILISQYVTLQPRLQHSLQPIVLHVLIHLKTKQTLLTFQHLCKVSEVSDRAAHQPHDEPHPEDEVDFGKLPCPPRRHAVGQRVVGEEAPIELSDVAGNLNHYPGLPR